MASQGQRQRSRDTDSHLTAVEGVNNHSTTVPANPEKKKALLNNPLQTPEKTKKDKAKDEEAIVTANEKDSISEGSIKVKQLSWIEAAGLMFTEYIVIAILSFPSSYSVLGMAGGVIATVIIGLVVLYTSHVLWRFCMKHPDSTDICDLSARLFPARWRKVAWIATSVAFLLNNLFIMGLHVLSGSVALNTLSDHSTCTVVFSAAMAIIMFTLSLVRELNQVAILGFIAASTMFVAFLLCLIFLGVQAGPAGWSPGLPITVRAWAAPGTTFVAGFNAILNISYTFIGQILIPSYTADMSHPEDFPKALYLCTFLEIVVFTLGGAVGYHYIGDQYITSPAYGSLEEPFTKIVGAFTLPTLIVVGVLYSSITCRFLFLRLFEETSRHRIEHTVKGWASWIAIVAVVWIVAFVIAEGIPFFNELLSLMSTFFDWYFGFVMEGLAFFSIYKSRGGLWTSPLRKLETSFNVLIIMCGIFILGGGAYSSISAINDDFANGRVAGAFTCADNGF